MEDAGGREEEGKPGSPNHDGVGRPASPICPFRRHIVTFMGGGHLADAPLNPILLIQACLTFFMSQT